MARTSEILNLLAAIYSSHQAADQLKQDEIFKEREFQRDLKIAERAQKRLDEQVRREEVRQRRLDLEARRQSRFQESRLLRQDMVEARRREMETSILRNQVRNERRNTNLEIFTTLLNIGTQFLPRGRTRPPTVPRRYP